MFAFMLEPKFIFWNELKFAVTPCTELRLVFVFEFAVMFAAMFCMELMWESVFAVDALSVSRCSSRLIVNGSR